MTDKIFPTVQVVNYHITQEFFIDSIMTVQDSMFLKSLERTKKYLDRRMNDILMNLFLGINIDTPINERPISDYHGTTIDSTCEEIKEPLKMIGHK